VRLTERNWYSGTEDSISAAVLPVKRQARHESLAPTAGGKNSGRAPDLYEGTRVAGCQPSVHALVCPIDPGFLKRWSRAPSNILILHRNFARAARRGHNSIDQTPEIVIIRNRDPETRQTAPGCQLAKGGKTSVENTSHRQSYMRESWRWSDRARLDRGSRRRATRS
jgi:hypothetical protein